MMCVRSVQHLGPGGGKYWLFRLVRSIAHANDVVLVLDGDDILHHPKALTIVNQKYLDTNAWFTYGSYTGKWSDQIINLSSDIRQHRTPFLPRKQIWVYGHPRTFKTFFLDHLRKMILNISTGRGLRKERIVASFIICSNLRVRRKLDTLPRRFTRIITYPRRQPWPQPPKKNDCLNWHIPWKPCHVHPNWHSFTCGIAGVATHPLIKVPTDVASEARSTDPYSPRE